jgi:hypothetical protein
MMTTRLLGSINRAVSAADGLTMKRPLGILLLACAATVAALGIIHRVLFPPTPKNADPGNRRLHQLVDDPVFHALPAGTQSSQLTLHPTTYKSPGPGQPGGWQTPYVTLTFESSATKQSIYGYYAERARAHGWHTTNLGPLGLPITWKKTYPNGASASLTLVWRGPTNPSGPLTYRLAGSIPLPAS